MPSRKGATKIQGIRVGSTGVTAVNVGANRVYSKTAIFFNFNTVVTPDMTSLGFVHAGPATAYKAISDGTVCRMDMPDGTSQLGEFIDRVRYSTAVAPADNGYLNFKFGSLGSEPSPSVTNYQTDILIRGSNSAVTHGVGVRAEQGELKILSRVGGTDTVRANLGSFDESDDFQMRFVGRLFTVYRNGEFVGEWTDTINQTGLGNTYRSLILRLTGGRELFGYRRFSPTIDYVEYG